MTLACSAGVGLLIAAAVATLAAPLVIAIASLARRQRRGPRVLRWENGRWVATYRRLR